VRRRVRAAAAAREARNCHLDTCQQFLSALPRRRAD
jgi:hypothetical protein